MGGSLSRLSRTAGPGIIFASTAIGVSHLVQSTRAGADFGLMLLGFVIIITVLKYPFFEYGSRYANSTGTSIIDGYARLGRPVLWMYYILTISSMFFITGAIGFVTAGFFENLFGAEFLGQWTFVVLLVPCVLVLALGRFGAMDAIIKVIMAVLIVSTAAAFVMVLVHGPVEQAEGFVQKNLWDVSGIFFLLALMGWMPTALDLSAWNSLWTIERIKQTGYIPKLRETLLEFRISYALIGVLAVMFLTLGAFIFYGSGEDLPNNNAAFAHQIVTLYTSTLGDWSYVIIAASAFSIMFGTVLTVLDGYTRSLHRTTYLAFGRIQGSLDMRPKRYQVVFLLVLCAGSTLIIFGFNENLKELVDFATVLSFMIAPVIAVFNYRLVTGRFIARGDQPSRSMKILSISGISFLSGFAAYFVYLKFLA